MKKIVLVAAICAATTYMAHACDACGGNAGGQYIGLLPGLQRNFAGLQWFTARYDATFPSAYAGKPDENTSDYFNMVRAWGRFRLGSHYQVFAFVPYQYSVRYGTGTRTTRDGIADVSLLLNRTLLRKTGKAYSHTLFAGAGVKAPTGAYEPQEQGGSISIPGLRPGTGSWDFMANANYTVQKGNAGINADAMFLYTTQSPGGYKYGNNLGAGLSAFVTKDVGTFRLMPLAGVRAEYTAKDYYLYSKKWMNEYSGGTGVWANCGLQIGYRLAGIRVSGMLPVYQRYAGGHISTRYRSEMSFFVLF